ncbi:hypothetical protein CUP0942 [Campylobacter upsaliensis RM3195]|nr:hypothetical protein [Campylobacter upsaliensis]EAL52314.1 hypothetical protein CUP0942 [Campylobacter upsaliensis RM3195]
MESEFKAKFGKSAGFGRVVPLGFGSFSGALLRGEKNIKGQIYDKTL